MRYEVLLHLLEVESGVLLKPLIALFLARDQHALVASPDRGVAVAPKVREDSTLQYIVLVITSGVRHVRLIVTVGTTIFRVATAVNRLFDAGQVDSNSVISGI